MGKHRAEDRPEGKSTSETVTGKRNDASQSKHRATGETTVDLSEKSIDIREDKQ